MEGEITRLTEENDRLASWTERGRWDRRVRKGTQWWPVRAQLSKAKAKAEKMEAGVRQPHRSSVMAEAHEATAKMSELEVEMKMHRQEAQRANQRAQALENTGGGDEGLATASGWRRRHLALRRLIRFRFRERK